MRIRSYLAVLALVCLFGGYLLDQVLAVHFDHAQILAEQHTKSLLWAKDLQRIEGSASQFLVSTDLVVASGNTYLIFGAQNMGAYLVEELSNLPSDAHYQSISAEIERSIVNVIQINRYLDLIADMPSDELDMRLRDLLSEYDPVSLALSQDIQFAMQETDNIIKMEEAHLQEEKEYIHKTSWIARGLFFSLVIALWWWANRRICKPLNDLVSSSKKSLAGKDFKATDNAPIEIIELSNDFKFLTETLSHQASHDPLTELHNRRLFERELSHVIKDKEHRYFLCFIDLDYFKTINDTCGHAAGDEILISVARILENNVRSYDTVARLGGDEFAILIKNCAVNKALKITNSIKEDINELSYEWEGEKFLISASIGVAEKMQESTTEVLLHAADIACAAAKDAGRNAVHLFDVKDLKVEEHQEVSSVHHVKNALENDLFVLYKQDIVSLQPQGTGKRFEILLRMLDNHGELVNPACFFPIAERYQLCNQVDMWVVNAVCDHFSAHPEQLVDIEAISINLSGNSLVDNDLKNFITNKLSSSQFPANKICFEITEAVAIANTKQVRLFMQNMKTLGCKFILDGFSGGNPSFIYIKELPIDIIKIDRVFISNLINEPEEHETVSAICAAAKAANQEVIAAFIEDPSVIDTLTELGVDYAQGYHFERPTPLV